MTDIHRNTLVKKAQKAHRCDHCFLPIPKGSSYNRCEGFFDGSSFSMKEHLECRDAYFKFNKDSDIYEWFPLDDSDDFKEHRDKIREIYRV